MGVRYLKDLRARMAEINRSMDVLTVISMTDVLYYTSNNAEEPISGADLFDLIASNVTTLKRVIVWPLNSNTPAIMEPMTAINLLQSNGRRWLEKLDSV